MPKTSTKLDAQQKAYVKSVVLAYLKKNSFVSNRIIRDIAGINYDQAIFFFGWMLELGLLKRIGQASATRYIVNKNVS